MMRASDKIASAAGFIIWSVCFIALYGLLSIACMLPTLGLPAMSEQGITAMLVIVWVMFIAAHVAAIAASVRRLRAGDHASGFVLRIGVYLNVAALGATLFFAAPILALRACQ